MQEVGDRRSFEFANELNHEHSRADICAMLRTSRCNPASRQARAESSKARACCAGAVAAARGAEVRLPGVVIFVVDFAGACGFIRQRTICSGELPPHDVVGRVDEAVVIVVAGQDGRRPAQNRSASPDCRRSSPGSCRRRRRSSTRSPGLKLANDPLNRCRRSES